MMIMKAVETHGFTEAVQTLRLHVRLPRKGSTEFVSRAVLRLITAGRHGAGLVFDGGGVVSL